MASRLPPVVTAVALVAIFLSSPAASVDSSDRKFQHPMTCLAKGPGTTSGELTVNVNGVTNPGTTDETVLCPIFMDSEGGWGGAPGTNATISVMFRPGSVAGRVTCTSFVATANGTSAATTTVVSDMRPANSGYWFVNIAVATPTFDLSNGGMSSASLACILGPKVTLLRVMVDELDVETFHSGP